MPEAERSARRGELLLCGGAAVALILLRTAVFAWYEQTFDSDQAIIGLMAKHLSEFRAFPLFFYGQNYMLGVQAWIAAPFFWLGGPTLTMLRLPLVLINIAVALMLIGLFDRNGLRPRWGFVAALPFMATPPILSGELMSNLGASVEPFLYVLLLWVLRRRPVAFGALLCIGTLHREFTIFALPAVLVVQWLEHRAIRWVPIFKGAMAFAAVWLVIDLLKLYGHTLGSLAPEGGRAESLTQEAVVIGQWLTFQPGPYLERLHDLVVRGLPEAFALRRLPVLSNGIPSSIEQGSRLASLAFRAAVVWCGLRLLWVSVRRTGRQSAGGTGFVLYLALIAVQTVLAYGLNGAIAIGAPTVFRYVLLAILLPVALFGGYLRSEPRAVWQWVASAFILVWAVTNAYDNGRLLREFIVTPPAKEHRALADFLTAHRIQYGWAGYWDCYLVDFLARERVILASSDIVRIDAYQRLVDENRSNAATVRRLPCDQGQQIASWCVEDPFKR